MQKSPSFVLLLLGIFIFTSHAVGAEGTIEGWESGGLGEWTVGSNDDIVTVDQQHAYEGSYGLHMDVDGDSSSSSYVYKSHPISVGDSFSVWIYSPNLNQEYHTASLQLRDSDGSSYVVHKADIGDFKCTTDEGYDFFGSVSESTWIKYTIDVNSGDTVTCHVDKQGGGSSLSNTVSVTDSSSFDTIRLQMNDKGSSINAWWDKLYGPLDNSAPSVDNIELTSGEWKEGTSVDLSVNASDPNGNLENVTAEVYEGGSVIETADLVNSSGTWKADNLFTVDEGDIYYNVSVTATDDEMRQSTSEKSKHVGKMSLSWSHSSDPQGFKVYSNATGSSSSVGTTSSTSFDYISSKVNSGGYYCFNVTAYNQYGESSPVEGCKTN